MLYLLNIIGEDIKGLIGEAEYSKLTETTQQYLEAAKAKDKKAGEPLLKEIQATLQTAIEKAE